MRDRKMDTGSTFMRNHNSNAEFKHFNFPSVIKLPQFRFT